MSVFQQVCQSAPNSCIALPHSDGFNSDGGMQWLRKGEEGQKYRGSSAKEFALCDGRNQSPNNHSHVTPSPLFDSIINNSNTPRKSLINDPIHRAHTGRNDRHKTRLSKHRDDFSAAEVAFSTRYSTQYTVSIRQITGGSLDHVRAQ